MIATYNNDTYEQKSTTVTVSLHKVTPNKLTVIQMSEVKKGALLYNLFTGIVLN